jgi:Starch-binding associating with outer membrane
MKKILLYTLSMGFLISSCKKIDDFGDINRDPNTLPTPNPAALFTNTLFNVAGSTTTSTVWRSNITQVASLYCQYMTETQYTEASRYDKQNVEWDGFYAVSLYDLQNIINTVGATNPNLSAAARIMRAYHYAFLTDMYGDIPYSDALKGVALVKYDKQDQVYPALLAELKAANAQFTATNGIAGDILFGGNVTSWKKFANSLRMILAMRWVKVDAAVAQAQFLDAYNDAAGHIMTNADNAKITFNGGANFPNPFYEYFNITQRDDYALSKPFMDFLTSTSDKRVNAYATSTIGFPYGLARADAVSFATANPNYARPMNNAYKQTTTPVTLISAAQIGLLRSEAALRTWITVDPEVEYKNAIKNSWDQWASISGGFTYTPADLTAYYANATINFTGNKLEKVYQQYWVSNYPNSWHGWADQRRTDFPVLTPAPGAGKPVPKRFPYGPNEVNLNPTNWAAAAAGYTVGGVANSQDGPVTWDR